MSKYQLPQIGGIRKVIRQSAAGGTSIAGLEGQTVTIEQLASAIYNVLTNTNTINTAPASAVLQVGPGLSGGGVLVGNVPLRLTASPPMFMIDDGADGEPGPPGARGKDGAAGATGATGFGSPGMPGEDGVEGDQGPPGPAGAKGATGATGATGFGSPGPPGEDGADGDQGWPGPAGATGAAGTPGATGGVGPPGAALFMMANDGEDGDPGPPGAPGAAGAAGAPGATGMMPEDPDYSADDIVLRGIPTVRGPQVINGPCTVNGVLTAAGAAGTVVFNVTNPSTTAVFPGDLCFGSSNGAYPQIGYNFAATTSVNVYNYRATDFSSAIFFNTGDIELQTAASGTAGNAITFTTQLKIANSGQATFTSWCAFNNGTLTAPKSGFGTPNNGPITASLTSASLTTQIAGTLAGLLLYLKTIGLIAA